MAAGPNKASCEECFFKRNGLCALVGCGPCPTFRPNRPEGLRPPRQMRFMLGQAPRPGAAWAFPTADEQARLHA